jgi:hypothetical protein
MRPWPETEGTHVTDISNGFQDPGDNKDADRKDLPMTQVDDEEVAKHSRSAAAEAPEGEGVGIGGEPSRLPREDEADGE